MDAEIISPRVIAAHDVAAARVAESYVRDLRRDTDATLGTLADHVHAWRACWEAIIRARDNRIKARLDLLEWRAEDAVKRELASRPDLAAKLIAIRAEQDRGHRVWSAGWHAENDDDDAS
jgi:hypothetical protein